MDLLYDHIAEDEYAKQREQAERQNPDEPQPTLNHEIQDAYKAFSASPWGVKIGGFLGNVVKQVIHPLATQLVHRLIHAVRGGVHSGQKGAC